MSSPPWLLSQPRRCSYALHLLNVIALCICLVGLTTGAALAQTPPPYVPENIPAPPAPPSAMLGIADYQQNCAPCHGMTGAGDGPHAAASDIVPQAINDPANLLEIEPAGAFHLAKFGSESGDMPALQFFMNDEQLWRAVFYAWSLHSSEEQVAEGAALYAEQCAACHGAAGQGDGPEAGDAEMLDFTDMAAMNVRSNSELDAGWRDAHEEVGAAWSETQRQSVLEYIRTFTYLPPWQSPFKPGDGAIEGRIVQGSGGAELAPAQEVTLMAYMNFTPVATMTTTTDVDGAYAFDRLSVDPDVVYYLGTRYQDVAYGSDLFAISPMTPTVRLDIPVYETTTDEGGIRIGRVHWVVDHRPGELVVREILAVGNEQDRTVVGRALDGADSPVTLALPIPANASNIEFQDGALGARYQQVDGVVYDTTPVRPGAQSRQILIGYTIPYTEKTATFAPDLAYPVDTLTLLVADLPGLEVETSAALESVGNQTLQDVDYRVWAGEISAAQPITIAMQNLIAPGEADPRTAQTGAAAPAAQTPLAAPIAPEATPTISPVFAALIVGALVLVIGGGFLYWKYSRDKRQTQQSLLEEKDRLLTEIAALDDRHTQGELDDESWSAERVTLMRSLRVVTDTLDRKFSDRKGGRPGA